MFCTMIHCSVYIAHLTVQAIIRLNKICECLYLISDIHWVKNERVICRQGWGVHERYCSFKFQKWLVTVSNPALIAKRFLGSSNNTRLYVLIHLNNILISSNLLTIIKFYQVNIVDTIIETQNKNNMISIKIWKYKSFSLDQGQAPYEGPVGS